MKTQYYTASSLDGFIADPQNALDWLLQFDMTDDYPAFIRDVGALAMGSTTYEWVLADLARSGPDRPPPWPYERPTWVFTSRSLPLPPVPGADVRFVSGDVRPVHAEMAAAAGGKNIWLVGGGELVGQFHDHGLLDELVVTVASVTLGGGAPSSRGRSRARRYACRASRAMATRLLSSGMRSPGGRWRLAYLRRDNSKCGIELVLPTIT